jgi:hypothetical protein
MISSQEFQQKLQAGQIHEALALVVRDTSELEILTQMTQASISIGSASSEYLRTKINLLTGEIHNEVSTDLVANPDNYRQLQQLHTDRIVASHRLVQGYLHQIEAILRVLSPILSETRSSLAQNRLDATALETLVNRSSPSIDDRSSLQQSQATVSDDLTFGEYVSERSSNCTHLVEPLPSLLVPTTDEIAPPALAQPLWNEHHNPIGLDEPLPTLAADASQFPLDTLKIDTDLDLAIDDGQVWEEWVEDDDFLAEVLPQPPSVSSVSTLPNWQDRLVRRHLNPIDVKPITPRATIVESVVPLARWDKFEPEYLGIGTDDRQPPQPEIDRDTARMAQLFADLDI